MLRQILIAGDSTVANRTPSENYESGICYTGWGEMLSLFLGINYRVINYSKSGLTTDTFRSEGHYEKLMNQVNEGDYVLFQFGHNDQKLKELHFNGRYKENLIMFINEVREKNAFPILVTPLSRNTWNCITNEYNDLLEEYANAVVEVSFDTSTFLVDLHEFSKNWILEKGLDGARPYFYPGDYTHTNDYGAFIFANYVGDTLKKVIKIVDEKFNWRSLSPSNIPKFLSENEDNYLTRREALTIVRVVGLFFAKNENIPTNRDMEIICAEQNGYKIFHNNLDELVTEGELLKLFTIAISGQNNQIKKIFETDAKNSCNITRKQAKNYLKLYEEILNIQPNTIKQEIKGC